MKTFLTLLIILFSNHLYSQNSISFVPGLGYFISNSENDLTLLKKKKLEEFIFLGVSYESIYFDKYNISTDYSLSLNYIDRIAKMKHNYDTSPIDYFLIINTLDFLLINQFENIGLYYGVGPSIFLTNRGLIFSSDFKDILTSAGVGLCSTIEGDLQTFNTFSIRGIAKIRYTHSIWHDEGVRKLNGYDQEFITAQLGIRFKFNIKQ